MRRAESGERERSAGSGPAAGGRARIRCRSGNPGGRPKAIISDWLRHELEALDPNTQQAVAQRVARVLIDKALAGDVRAIQVLAERVEGKVAQAVEGNLTVGLGEGMRIAMEQAEERLHKFTGE